MKALFIGNDPNIFDTESAARERMREYAHAIGELHIISPAPKTAWALQEGNLFLYPVHTSKLFRVRALAKRAHKLILEKDIEIVSAQDPFEHGLAALKAVSGTHAKLHVQIHTDFLSPWFAESGSWRVRRMRMAFLNRSRRRIADRVLPKARGIRVVSERIKKSVMQKYASSIAEPTVIPIVVDSAIPAPVSLPEHPHFMFPLICVGRLEPEKHVEDILAALARVAQKYPTAGLVVVGDGRERVTLEKRVKKLELEKNVIFLGNRPDAWGLMRSAQAFVQASAYEGAQRTLVEAALAKVPIITTDVGIVGEVFTDGKEVLSVPVGDPVALSHAIINVIEDNNLRVELPIRAEEKARAHIASIGDLPTRISNDLEATLHTNG